jgi:hypothetical protein
LTEAFHTLGGKDWLTENTTDSSSDVDADVDADASQLKANLNRLVLSNQYGALDLGGAAGADEEGEESDDEAASDKHTGDGSGSTPGRRRQARPGKGKKGKKGKRPKKQQLPASSKEPHLDNLPLESYRIIQDTEGIITDYLMAVYALVQEWSDLRAYVQGVWREVAYDGLNSAIAGTVSILAVAMIQRSAFEMFVDFPGHDAYETVMNTITRGDPEKAQGRFTASLMAVAPNGETEKVTASDIDVKEQFMIHTYRDLIDFIEDFQKTRSGKPTKRMLAEIRDWDPEFDLQKPTNQERIRWRRSYTINWLYDLVNVFSSIVVQRNTMKGEAHVLEKVDWSPDGPWDKHRRLFGLNEFAGLVTSLAMQKQGTDIRSRILPHHVFQLQCIVDCLTVSRGWSLSLLRGHIVNPPPRSFRPRRDVDLFLDRNNERVGHGFLTAVNVLRQLFVKDAALHQNHNRHREIDDFLEGFYYEFCNWLGESKYMHGLTNIPPSRFSNTNANGLWEYSPFLCGVGLMEGLEIAYLAGMMVWERLPEPMMIIHLHNMLVKKGYFKKPVGLYATLEQLFAPAFFLDGKAPSSDFSAAFLARMRAVTSTRKKWDIARKLATKEHDIHRMMTVEAHRFFRIKSDLLLYRQSKWNIDAIPDADIPLTSPLAILRISQTKQIVDPISHKTKFEDTEFIKRARAGGMTDEVMLDFVSGVGTMGQESGPITGGYNRIHRSTNPKNPFLKEKPKATNTHAFAPNSREILEIAKADLYFDISGEVWPLSSLNYISVTGTMMMVFSRIEARLTERRNRLYVRAYDIDIEWAHFKRMGLTQLAMHEEDEECLRIMAEVFEEARFGFQNFVYWEKLEEFGEYMERRALAKVLHEDVESNICSVM